MAIRQPKSRSNFTLSISSNSIGSNILAPIGEQLIRISPFSTGTESATVYLYCEDDVENALATAIKSIRDSFSPFSMKLDVIHEGNVIETYTFVGCSLGASKVGGFDHSSTKPDIVAEELVLSSYNKDFNSGSILKRIGVRYHGVTHTFVS